MELVLLITTVSVFIIFLLWENFAPAREYEKDSKKNSYITNGGVFIFNNAVTYVLSIGAVYVFASKFSINPMFNFIPGWLAFIIGVLFLDLAIWFWHRINHRVKFLWLFHQTHHAETYLNASSALRFHIGELLLSVLFKTVLLIVTGIPLWVFVFYESLITIFAIFHHANISLGKRAESFLERIIISPRMHQAHHSDIRKEHDSNYGVLFSWWDIVFKTKNDVAPKRIGLTYGGEKNIWSFLIMPLVDRK